jgi:hypothetical protein
LTDPIRRRGRPSRSAIFAAVDEGVDELLRIGGLPAPSENEAIWADIWHEETHHSTAIEGNTLLLDQVRALLERGVVTGAPKALREILEVQAYAEAARWVYEQARPGAEWSAGEILTLTEVRELHRLVIGPVWLHFPPANLVPEEGPGAFRRHGIRPFASGLMPPSFTEVPALVHDWLRNANVLPSGDRHPIEHLAELHARFEQIHPFFDGNGRVGRLLLNLMLVRRQYPPAVLLKRDRRRYLAALSAADDVRRVGNLAMMMPEGTEARRPNYLPLAELIARAVRHGLDRFLLPGLAGPHRMLPITALADNRVSLLALRRAAEKGRLRAQVKGGRWYSTKQSVDVYLASRRRGKR